MYKKISIIALMVALIALATPVAAIEFDPNYIISDADFLSIGEMNLEDVQNFLNEKGGALATLSLYNYLEEEKTAAEIIYEAALMHAINPKFLIVMLQKEMSLITHKDPTERMLDWAMGYGVCDSCSVEDPRVIKFKGFGKQVERAAGRNKQYYDEHGSFHFSEGETYMVDDTEVTPQNKVTAGLYNYTPHIHGNYNFWRIWNGWFAKNFPDGSLLKIEGVEGYWIIDNGFRRPFISEEAFRSRFYDEVPLEISKADLEKYPVGSPIKYPQYSLVRDENQNIYLLVNDEKKRFASYDVYRKIGYHPEEIMDVPSSDLAHYTDGRLITENLIYPAGALVQDISTGGVYYVEDGIKSPIWSPEILALNYPNRSMFKLSPEELAGYPTGVPVKFKDRLLIMSPDNPNVYLTSNGKRRHITNEQTFEALGYGWNDIVVVSNKVLEMHPLGERVDVIDTTTTVAFSN